MDPRRPPGRPQPPAGRPGTPKPPPPRPRPARPPVGQRYRWFRILLQPGQEWDTIAGEFTTVGQIYKSYVMRLALVPAVSLIVGSIVFGRATLFGRIKIPVVTALQSGALSYVLWLVAVYAIALLIDALASTFGGTANRVQAVKVAAYSCTAAYLAGVFVLVPGGEWLRIIALYSLYLLYSGLAPVMKVPKDRTLGYGIVTAVAAIVAYLVMDFATLALLPRG